MKLIPDTIDLRNYRKAPAFASRICPASLFTEAVTRELDPVNRQNDPTPSMLSAKARHLRFRPGEVTCWSGYNGHRKSMFTSQVALDLASQRQKVLVVSLEMSPVPTRKAPRSANPAGMKFPNTPASTNDSGLPKKSAGTMF